MRFEFNDDSQKICNSADVANYGIQCDICGNKVLSVSNINGKRYCAGCHYKTFIKDNQQTEIDQLKQQLEESFTEEDVNGLIEDRDKTIKFLQKELAEKDKEIKKLNWQLKDKDFIIKNLNHSLSIAPNANAGQRARIDELTKIVKEKDKETEKLKQQYTILENENGKLTTELIMGKYKKAQKEVSFGMQLAIQELAEVERLLYESHYKEIDGKYYAEYEDIKNLIDSRIKALEKEDA